jgi:alpha-tubulin suppressor-like RCC1 family protein
MKPGFILLSGLSALLLSVGCTIFAPHAPVEILDVEVTSTAVVLEPGDTTSLIGFPIYGDYRDPFDRPYPPLRANWSSSDPGVVAVEGSRMRAISPGTAILTVRHGALRDTATVVVRAEEPALPAVRQLSLGNGHGCLIGAEGQVACWGSNTGGMIGVGDARLVVNYLAPVPLQGAVAIDIAAGRGISCYLGAAGTAHCWGEVAGSPSPRPVAAETPFTELSTGWFTACGLTAEGAVHCWGREPGDAPVRQLITDTIVQIDGECGLTTEGAVRCWGRSEHLSTGAESPAFELISAGFRRVCGLDAEGVAHCWGANEHGQLGTGQATDTCRMDHGPAFPCTGSPAPVLAELRFTDLAVGNGVICGVSTEGRAHCWGAWNRQGALGTGGFEPSVTPVPVASAETFQSLVAHESTVCGVATSGTAYCWGGSFPGDGRTWIRAPESTTGTPAPVAVRRPVR